MKRIITISREFGSGGRYIGKLLAEKLGIDFYDRELIYMIAKKSNYSEEFVEKNEEIKTTSFLFNLATEGYYANNPYGVLSPNDKMFLAQTEIIQELANKSPCVIVGRYADYILKDRDDVLNVFVTCDMPHRIERCVKYYGINPKQVEKTLKKKDKVRSSNYNYYTNGEWGVCRNYDITINSGTLGVENCVEVLAKLCSTNE